MDKEQFELFYLEKKRLRYLDKKKSQETMALSLIPKKTEIKIVIIKKKKNHRDGIHRKIFFKERGEINKCEECGSCIGLNIHHIDKDRKNNNIANLIMLCLPCHIQKHKLEPIARVMTSRLNSILKNI